MYFDKFKKIKAAIFRRSQAFIPMALVGSLLLVGYAAIDKEAPVIITDSITVNFGEEIGNDQIQIEDNQASVEELTIRYDTTALNLYKVGTSQVTVYATDTANNTASKTIEVNVVDQEKPFFHLIESENVKVEKGVLVINLNSSNDITDYIMAIDNADGDVTAYINQIGALDTSKISKQSVNLSVSDSSGNDISQSFDIEIRDIVAPIMKYVDGDSVEVSYGSDFNLSKYVTVKDNSKVTKFAPTKSVDTKAEDKVTYTIVATDQYDNTSNCELEVVVKDDVAPVIDAQSTYDVLQGKSFNILSNITVTDNKDRKITPEVIGTVDTSTVGTYKLIIRAIDQAGNKATKTVMVNVNTINAQIVALAKTKVGCAYVAGGRGPDAFDCSGFTQWLFAQFGITIGRSTHYQYAGGTKIPYESIQPGDLIFWSCHGEANSHVSMYIGNGMIVHAANEHYGVCFTSVANMLQSAPMYGCVRY